MRNADFIGHYGRAWRVDLAPLYAKANVPEDVAKADPLVAIWVLDSPMSHPLWWWYRITLINLQRITTPPPPHIYLEGATHELVLDALDPEHYPPPIDDIPHKLLSPSNFASQIICASDEEAIERLERDAVKRIVNGTLNPDTDWRSHWEVIFGDNMIKR